jgi:hypothetical protein
MSTHAIIAANFTGGEELRDASRVEGRYVHLDGYPEGVGAALARIVKRDGYDKAIATLMLKYTDWSSVNALADQPGNWGIVVPDYGVANSRDTDGDREWYPIEEGETCYCGAHYGYVMWPTCVDIYQVVGGVWMRVEHEVSYDKLIERSR